MGNTAFTLCLPVALLIDHGNILIYLAAAWCHSLFLLVMLFDWAGEVAIWPSTPLNINNYNSNLVILYVWCCRAIINSIQKQPSCKKKCGPKEGHCEKDVKSKVAAKNDRDGRLKAKNLITTIRLNLCCLSTFHYDLQIFAISLPSQPFLATTLDFTFFSQWPSWGRTLFLQLGSFWITFHFFL